MLSNYQSYLNYKEIRRRVEKRLKNGNGLFIHGIIFFAVNIVIWAIWYNSASYSWGYGVFFPGLMTAGWSWLVFFHAIRTYLKSGVWSDARGNAVEQEMRDLLDVDDGYTDQQDYFVMHRMLDEDVAQRAGFVTSLALFAAANAFSWFLWVIAGAQYFDYAVWALIFFAAMAILPAGAVINLWRSNRRERRRMEENIPVLNAEKQKHRRAQERFRQPDDEEEPAYSIAELMEAQKRTRR